MPTITAMTPTPFLRRDGDVLRQQARVTITHDGAAVPAEIDINGLVTPITLTNGEAEYAVELAELTAPGEIIVALRVNGTVAARQSVAWMPPKHWTVHVVQLSHHDVGYTDLASNVLREHDCWLDAAIDMAAATRDWPDAARFRLVIEQCWSIDHFLRHAHPERMAAMLALLHAGDFELTALFGNLTTELCGHESLARSVYPAFHLKREFGIPILSAEHNDVPGFTWGLAQVLTEAGIQLFCPGLPKYYNWGHPEATSFWDEVALFGAEGMPGAFWWQAPGGKRVLFWSNNQGCGGDCHADIPGLAPHLQQLAAQGYPYDVLRWPVQGGARDNSPYIDGYAKSIRDWNACWAFPRLVCSTNTRFYADLLPQLPADLPVRRGELPGQDYPVGAASTAAATAVNRRNHADLPAAEALATIAAALTDYTYQHATLTEAMEDVHWHDEHTWGHHFPAGPSAATAELEKALHAHRAAALAHDVASKAMARVADAVRVDAPGLHLVVFNALGHTRSGLVRTPLREITNCGSTMHPMPDGALRGVLLTDRWQVVPPLDIADGCFDLIDVATGDTLPFQIVELESPLGYEAYAAQRLGLGAGGKRYGVFEKPAGLTRDLLFHATDVPALGYRTYHLRPRTEQPAFPFTVSTSALVLENKYYRLTFDSATGCIAGFFDKRLDRELVDASAEHPFGMLVTRDPFGEWWPMTCEYIRLEASGPVSASLTVLAACHGCPRAEITYMLYADEPRLDVSVKLLKDPTPLLETYLAFPFHLPGGAFRCEGPLCVTDPTTDLLPGAFADRLTVQNWVCATDGDATVHWSSLDAPVVSLGCLWPGRVSPAHSAVLRRDIEHPHPDIRGGAIYALLTANNFGTNFAVSQSGLLRFQFSMTSRTGTLSDADAASIGRACHTPFTTNFTEHDRPRHLPPVSGFLILDNPAVQLVAFKQAEDHHGLILRLWNPTETAQPLSITCPSVTLTGAVITSLTEEDGDPMPVHANRLVLMLQSRAVITVRVLIALNNAGDTL